MRDIKFRVWNGMSMEHDVMAGRFGHFYVNPMEKKDGLYPNDSASLSPFNTIFDPEQHPLMQYTGLKDSNQKEIYEADIVKYDGFFWGVEFVNGCWQIAWDGGLDIGYVLNELEVVGNIYQNDDLIN